MGPTLFPIVFWCDRGWGSDSPSRRKAYRGCHIPRARKRAWLGSLSPCGPSLSFGVGLRLDAFFRAYPSKSGSVNLPSLSGEIPHGHGWNAPPKVRFAADSAQEGDGFEPSVPRKWDNAFRVSRVLRAAPNVAPAVGDARCFDKSP